MKVASILPLVLVILAILTHTVEQAESFSVSIKKPRKKGFSRMRVPSLNLGRLEKILRAKGSPMKRKLSSMDKWLKKYEERVGETSAL